MKKIHVFLSLAVVAALAGCSKSNPASATASGGDSAPAQLKIKWPAGQKYQMHVDLMQDSEMTMPQQAQPMKQNMNVGEDYSIAVAKDLANGGKQLEMKIENLVMDMTVNGNSMMTFDSKQSPSLDKTNNPLATVFRKVAGTPVRLATDANGKVEKIENMDELKDRMGNSRNPAEWAVYKQMFSEDTLKQYGNFADSMPDKAVSPGDSWNVSRTFSSPMGAVTVDLKYTLKNWEQHNDRRCAHLENSGDLSLKKVKGEAGPSIDVQDGKVTGETWVDPELGMVVDATSHQNMTLKVVFGKQSITPKVSQTIRFMLVDMEQKAK